MVGTVSTLPLLLASIVGYSGAAESRAAAAAASATESHRGAAFVLAAPLNSGQQQRATSGRTAVTHSDVCYCRLQASVTPISGMGMQEAEDTVGGGKKKKKKKKKSSSSSKGGGLGMSSSSSSSSSKRKGKKNGQYSSSPFDASASLARSNQSYDKICLQYEKYLAADDDNDAIYDNAMLSEYMIAARCGDGAIVPSAAVSDWVPVAQLCMVRPDAASEGLLQAAISYYCREIHHAASIAAPGVFSSIPRNALQYSVEPLDSFFKYVYEDVLEENESAQKKQKEGKDDEVTSMTRAQARQVLELDENCHDLSVIKKAYRNLSFQYHPDRFVGVERTGEEAQQTSTHYLRIKTAYETLRSGLRSEDPSSTSLSWYESLGGRSRTDFMGPIVMTPRMQAQETLQRQTVGSASKQRSVLEQTAICEIDESLVMAFVARNQLSARLP